VLEYCKPILRVEQLQGASHLTSSARAVKYFTNVTYSCNKISQPCQIIVISLQRSLNVIFPQPYFIFLALPEDHIWI